MGYPAEIVIGKLIVDYGDITLKTNSCFLKPLAALANLRLVESGCGYTKRQCDSSGVF